MRYEVPQFIDIKDKIVGPFTLAQFLYLGGGVAGAYACFRLLFTPLNIIVAIFLIILGVTLGFYQYEGRPFPEMLFAMITFTLKKKLYIWKFRPDAVVSQAERTVDVSDVDTTLKNVDEVIKTAPSAAITVAPLQQPPSETKTSRQKLQDIAWGLDVLDKR